MTPCPNCSCPLQRMPFMHRCTKCGGKVKKRAGPDPCIRCIECRSTFPLVRGYSCLNCGTMWDQMPVPEVAA